MSLINIFLVDDHKIIRDGLRSLLLANKEIKIIGEASRANELFEKLKTSQPEIIVLDITLPGMTGVEILKVLTRDFADIKVLILSANTDEKTLVATLKAGARGFLPKDTSKEEFIQAIKSIAQGEQYFGKTISQTLYKSFINSIREGTSSENQELSLREIEIIKLFADGLSYKEIAEKLFISSRTVETHKNNILKKLELKNTIDLVKYAIKNKLVEI